MTVRSGLADVCFVLVRQMSVLLKIPAYSHRVGLLHTTV